ncbi:MAG TPA: Bro-N domain-containing protein [Pseudomonadales bacterium]|nr:Bro-N domain-containing protein [Pseudomonadales bacterium]
MESETNKIKLFESAHIRTQWDADAEKWWFSVVDVIAILTDQPTPDRARKYWSVMKTRLKQEGAEPTTICSQLKLQAHDGKMRLTDVADTQQLLRLIQSIPSKKAEPFKQWLAQVGSERLDETVDPELSIERAIQNYRTLGYSENWINQRIKSIEVRKALTDEWDKAGVQQGQEYAALTDLMSRVWSGMSTREYKQHKDLKKENLRDNMTNTELVLNMLAEVAATDISQVRNPEGFDESAQVAKEGAKAAKAARQQLEKSTGKTVISKLNAKQLALKNNEEEK